MTRTKILHPVLIYISGLFLHGMAREEALSSRIKELLGAGLKLQSRPLWFWVSLAFWCFLQFGDSRKRAVFTFETDAWFFTSFPEGGSWYWQLAHRTGKRIQVFVLGFQARCIS